MSPTYELNSPSAGIVERLSDKLASPQQRWPARAVKRLIDIAGSLFLLILIAPFLPLIALLIRLDSPGPIFFCPRIIGRNGKVFKAYKFRSMDAGAFQKLLQNPDLLNQYKKNLKLTNDPRVTRIGRWLRRTSIDELPQLFNVLKGDMSLVGPRMLAELELEKFGEYRDTILSVKPGMAGLWVASGRHRLSFERRLELELEYIRNWSLWLDVKCFCKTLFVALAMVGAE